MSQDLRTCTDKVVLNLEDDAPRVGARAVFLMDIENPCWLLPAADLTQARALTVAVGQVPFNFQIGRDRDAIRFDAPRTRRRRAGGARRRLRAARRSRSCRSRPRRTTTR